MKVKKQVSSLGKKAALRREPHMVFGQIYKGLSKHWRIKREGRDERKQKCCAQKQHLQERLMRTAERHAARADCKVPDSGSRSREEHLLTLARPSTAAAKTIQSKHGSPHSRLNRTKPTPRNKLDRRAHHVTQLTLLKSRILNVITNDTINWCIGLKPKANNSLL